MRAIVDDDSLQSPVDRSVLADAEVIAISLVALCELVWVLSRGYRILSGDIAETIRRLIGSANVLANRPAIAAGLAVLNAGGDIADGVIAHEGRWLGADVFVSFDRKATLLIDAQKEAT